MNDQSNAPLNLYPDGISTEELGPTIARRGLQDCELRRIRLGTRSLRSQRWYALEVWGAFRKDECLGFFRRHGHRGFIFQTPPYYIYTYIGEAAKDTTVYSNAINTNQSV
jgi:hypothetical protein